MGLLTSRGVIVRYTLSLLENNFEVRVHICGLRNIILSRRTSSYIQYTKCPFLRQQKILILRKLKKQFKHIFHILFIKYIFSSVCFKSVSF